MINICVKRGLEDYFGWCPLYVRIVQCSTSFHTVFLTYLKGKLITEHLVNKWCAELKGNDITDVEFFNEYHLFYDIKICMHPFKNEKKV